MSLAFKNRVINELLNLVDKEVEVVTVQGKSYKGKIVGIEPESFNVVLSDAKDAENNSYPLIALHGTVVGEIKLLGQYYNLKELADKLEKIFPRLVSYDESSKIIIVADKIKVHRDGTVEGTGPLADKVRAACNEFFKQ
jgi:Gemin6 protein.